MSNKISRLLRWARITKAGSDTEQFATQQMSSMGKVADGLIVFPYGHHGNVPADALALMFAVQGNPDNRAAIAWTPKDRPQLAAGEVAFYHPPTGGKLVWKANGDLEITTEADVKVTAANIDATATDAATITAPTITLDGDVVITGATSMQGATTVAAGMAITGTVTANGKVIDDTHGHIQGNDGGGDAEQPISGVT